MNTKVMVCPVSSSDCFEARILYYVGLVPSIYERCTFCQNLDFL